MKHLAARSLGSGAAHPIKRRNMRSSLVSVVRADVEDAYHGPADRPEPVPEWRDPA
jgi:hypothetical protein